MTDINSLFIVGRLTRDSELRFSTSGTPVCNFSIAVNKSKKNGDKWEDEVSYFDCVLWGKQGESLSGKLIKGKQVALSGSLEQKRWEQDGQSKSRVVININGIQLMGGSRDEG